MNNKPKAINRMVRQAAELMAWDAVMANCRDKELAAYAAEMKQRAVDGLVSSGMAVMVAAKMLAARSPWVEPTDDAAARAAK